MTDRLVGRWWSWFTRNSNELLKCGVLTVFVAFVAMTLTGRIVFQSPLALKDWTANLTSGLIGSFVGAGVAIWWSTYERRQNETRRRKAVLTALYAEMHENTMALLTHLDYGRTAPTFVVRVSGTFEDHLESVSASLYLLVCAYRDSMQALLRYPSSILPVDDWKYKARVRRDMEELAQVFSTNSYRLRKALQASGDVLNPDMYHDHVEEQYRIFWDIRVPPEDRAEDEADDAKDNKDAE